MIVLGFDKDVPAQAVGRLAQLMRSRPDAPSPRFHFGELLSWIGREAQAKKQYRQASALDPKGLIGRFARSVLEGLELNRPRISGKYEKEIAARSANHGGHEHSHLARGFGRARSRRAR